MSALNYLGLLGRSLATGLTGGALSPIGGLINPSTVAPTGESTPEEIGAYMRAKPGEGYDVEDDALARGDLGNLIRRQNGGAQVQQVKQDNRTPQQLAGDMIPGVPATNWLSTMLGNIQHSMHSQPTPDSQAAEARRVAELRRARTIQQLQNNAAAAGRPPLSQNEIEHALATQGW